MKFRSSPIVVAVTIALAALSTAACGSADDPVASSSSELTSEVSSWSMADVVSFLPAAGARPALAMTYSDSSGPGAVLRGLRQDGSEAWKAPLGFPLSNKPALGLDGTVFAQAERCQAEVCSLVLEALDPASGSVKWTTALGSRSSFSYARDNELVVNVVTGDIYSIIDTQTFVAVHPDGTEAWRRRWVANRPAVAADGTVYVARTLPNRVEAISPVGTDLWSVATDVISAPPTAAQDGTVYVGDWEGNLVAIAPDGTTKWKTPTSQGHGGLALRGAPQVGPDGTIFVEHDTNRDPLYPRSEVVAVGPKGAIAWRTPSRSFLVGTEGNVFVAPIEYGAAREFCAHAGNSGAIVQCFGNGRSVPLAAADGILYAARYGGPGPGAIVTFRSAP